MFCLIAAAVASSHGEKKIMMMLLQLHLLIDVIYY